MFFLARRTLVTTVLEKLLNLLLTQIILCDKLMQHSDRDRKLFKRELSTEIVSHWKKSIST